MRRLLAIALATALLALAPRADARKVRWQKIEVRKGDDAYRVEKNLSRLLKNASKRAKWGDGKPVKLSARLTKLSWERYDDVLRVSVTIVARIMGGKGARSHIRIGGHPKDRAKLEKQALKIVSDGLITRLSDMARTEAKAAADKKKAEKEKADKEKAEREENAE